MKVRPSIGLAHDTFQAATQLLQKHPSAGPKSTGGLLQPAQKDGLGPSGYKFDTCMLLPWLPKKFIFGIPCSCTIRRNSLPSPRGKCSGKSAPSLPKCPFAAIAQLLVNAEHYGRAGANPRVCMGMRSIATYIYTSFKKTQPYLVILYMYNITISEKHIAQ